MPQVVNNELNYKIKGNDKDKEQRPYPGNEVNPQENTCQQAINKRSDDYFPVTLYEVTKGQLFLPGIFYCQNQEKDSHSAKQGLGDVVVSEAEYGAPQKLAGQHGDQGSRQHTSPFIEQCFTDEVNGDNGQGGQDRREISANHVYGMLGR